MPTVNHLRKQGMYFKAISAIVNEVTNSDMSYVTVTSVKLSGDSSHLDVFVTFEKNPERSLEALDRAKGFVRSQLASFSNQRIIPHIHFKLDTSYEEGSKIDKILADIKKADKK